jgi:hypothetical protein
MHQHGSKWTCPRCGGNWTIVVKYEGPAYDPAKTLKNTGTVACLTAGCPGAMALLVDPDWQVAEINVVPRE